MALRKGSKAMEVIWRGSTSWGAASDVFTHNYPSGNYVRPLVPRMLYDALGRDFVFAWACEGRRPTPAETTGGPRAVHAGRRRA